MSYSVTRRLEIDAAHRIPDHASKCFNIHGHRYVIEATVAGELFGTGSQKGMVLDFSFLKEIMIKVIHDPCDHGIIFYKNDPIYLELAGKGMNQVFTKMHLIDAVPTAENLAHHWYIKMRPLVNERTEGRGDLESVKVYETPNCFAVYP